MKHSNIVAYANPFQFISRHWKKILLYNVYIKYTKDCLNIVFIIIPHYGSHSTVLFNVKTPEFCDTNGSPSTGSRKYAILLPS